MGAFKEKLSAKKIYTIVYNNQKYSTEGYILSLTDKKGTAYENCLCFGNIYLLSDYLNIPDDIINTNEKFGICILFQSDDDNYTAWTYSAIKDENSDISSEIPII